MKKSLIVLLLFILTTCSFKHIHAEGDEKGMIKFTISGTVKDATTGEDLIGATVLVRDKGTGTTTNVYGFYSISLTQGKYTLVYSYIGYDPLSKEMEITKNLTYNIELQPIKSELKEVVVSDRLVNENVKKAEMSVIKMDVKTIRQIPALMGEVDVIKAIQLLPGVLSTSEGGSGFSVRGGSPDQNLVLLDEAAIYNASHLLGFFSVFNNDAIKDVKLYKGDIPASNGGRLSSLLDIRMKDGNSKKISGTGGIGTISSRFTLEGPLPGDNVSYLISGRRTYADLFLRLSRDKEIRDNILYFYDLNAKINYTIDDNNRVFLSGYYGKDIFRNPDFRMGWGNRTLTGRWNHVFNKKLFLNTSIITSRYEYDLGVPEGEANSFSWLAKMENYGMKADFNFYLNPDNTIRFGVNTTFHRFNPGSARGTGDETFFNEFKVQLNQALENAIYISNEQKYGARLIFKFGLRFSNFQNVGETVIYNYDENYNYIDSTYYTKGEFFNPFFNLEPRLGITFMLDEYSSIKANFTRNVQYIHLAQNSTAGTPLDVWFPSSPNVKPQIGDQVAIGYFRNSRKNDIEASAEIYYKTINNAVDFKDHAELLLNRQFEGELRFGKGLAYGAEFMVRFDKMKYSGWISYTYSRSERKIETINDGKSYTAPYDKPHNISIVLNYLATKRLMLGATWVYSTGLPVTFPTGRFEFGGLISPVYSNRNAYRLPDYHRLDLSLTLKGKEKEGKKWFGEWNLSVYNAYARKNAWVINFEQDPDDPSITYAEKTYLFSIIPSITYNFHF